MSYWIGVFWISNSVLFLGHHHFCLNVRCASVCVCARIFSFSSLCTCTSLNMSLWSEHPAPAPAPFCPVPFEPFFISFGHYLLYATQWCSFLPFSFHSCVYVCVCLCAFVSFSLRIDTFYLFAIVFVCTFLFLIFFHSSISSLQWLLYQSLFFSHRTNQRRTKKILALQLCMAMAIPIIKKTKKMKTKHTHTHNQLCWMRKKSEKNKIPHELKPNRENDW